MKRGRLFNQVNNGNDKDDDAQTRSSQNQNQRPRLITTWWPIDEKFLQEYGDELENVVRKVVREELEPALQRHLPSISRCSPNQPKQTEPRKYKLHFVGNLPGRFFTDSYIQAEGPSSIRVVLLDAISGRIINDGSLSSVKVEIVVLHGNFKVEQLECWTKRKFNDNIVTERHEKGPLLAGECVITLRNGMGSINKIKFRDNSSWVPSKMFRLGARVIHRDDDIVMEAVSSAFRVMHKRGETDQKRDTPSPDDRIWRLHGIAKNGKICKRLAEYQIHTVNDLVRQFHIDQNLLQQILGVTGRQLKVIFETIPSLSDIIYANPSDMSPNDTPTDHLITSNSTIPSQHQQQFYAPNPDHTVITMPCNDGANQTIHQLHESVPVNQVQITQLQSAIMDTQFPESYNEGHGYALNCPWHNPSSSTGHLFEHQNMFDVPASNWFVANGSLVGSTINCQFEPFDPMVTNVAGSSGSSQAKSKDGWSKVRAGWRILIKHDDATLRKGHFHCQC